MLLNDWSPHHVAAACVRSLDIISWNPITGARKSKTKRNKGFAENSQSTSNQPLYCFCSIAEMLLDMIKVNSTLAARPTYQEIQIIIELQNHEQNITSTCFHLRCNNFWNEIQNSPRPKVHIQVAFAKVHFQAAFAAVFRFALSRSLIRARACHGAAFGSDDSSDRATHRAWREIPETESRQSTVRLWLCCNASAKACDVQILRSTCGRLGKEAKPRPHHRCHQSDSTWGWDWWERCCASLHWPKPPCSKLWNLMEIGKVPSQGAKNWASPPTSPIWFQPRLRLVRVVLCCKASARACNVQKTWEFKSERNCKLEDPEPQRRHRQSDLLRGRDRWESCCASRRRLKPPCNKFVKLYRNLRRTMENASDQNPPATLVGAGRAIGALAFNLHFRKNIVLL